MKVSRQIVRNSLPKLNLTPDFFFKSKLFTPHDNLCILPNSQTRLQISPLDLSCIYIYTHTYVWDKHLKLSESNQPCITSFKLPSRRGNENKSVFSRRVLIPLWRYLTHFSTFQDSMVWTIHLEIASVSGKILDNSITVVTVIDFWQNTFRLH